MPNSEPLRQLARRKSEQIEQELSKPGQLIVKHIPLMDAHNGTHEDFDNPIEINKLAEENERGRGYFLTGFKVPHTIYSQFSVHIPQEHYDFFQLFKHLQDTGQDVPIPDELQKKLREKTDYNEKHGKQTTHDMPWIETNRLIRIGNQKYRAVIYGCYSDTPQHPTEGLQPGMNQIWIHFYNEAEFQKNLKQTAQIPGRPWLPGSIAEIRVYPRTQQAGFVYGRTAKSLHYNVSIKINHEADTHSQKIQGRTAKDAQKFIHLLLSKRFVTPTLPPKPLVKPKKLNP